MGRKIVDRNEYDNKVSKENKWLAKDFLQEKKSTRFMEMTADQKVMVLKKLVPCF